MKVTIVQKVLNLLNKNGEMSMSEICKELSSEHSAAGIRGNIYRYLKKSDALIRKVSKGRYAAIKSNISKKKEAISNIISFKKYASKNLESKSENNLSAAVGFAYPSVFNSLDSEGIKSSLNENIYRNDNNNVLSFPSAMKGISQVNFTGGNSRYEREQNDYYATNPETVRSFLEQFHKDNIFEGSILECACGEGHISKVLEEEYPNSEIISTDLIDRGFGEGGIDFLTHDYKRKFDNIITNPPFRYITQFIERGLRLAKRFVIMLGRIQTLESTARKTLLQNTPLKYVYVHSKRQSTWKNGEPTDSNGKPWSSVMCLAWFVWDKTYEGEPIIRWI